MKWEGSRSDWGLAPQRLKLFEDFKTIGMPKSWRQEKTKFRELKTDVNVAGSTQFVHPVLVKGTLREGLEFIVHWNIFPHKTVHDVFGE